MSEKIENVEHPAVGRFYSVPCVRHVSGQWFPIIGPWHEDAEDVGFADHHFHFDVRFFYKAQRRYYQTVEFELARVHTASVGPADIVYKRRKMLREMPDFPYIQRDGQPVVFVRKLEERFRNQKLSCKVCPHRGMPLKGLPAKDGLVVCNGHGLRWNIETGEMVPRVLTKTHPERGSI